jgi:hypothetical protein
VEAETKESTKKAEEKLDGRNKEGHERKNIRKGQSKNRNKWRLGVGQRRKTFGNRYTYIHTYILT